MDKKYPSKSSLATNSDYTSGSKLDSQYTPGKENSVTMSDNGTEKDTGTNKRGFMVFIFCLMNFSVGFLSSPLAPISKATRIVYPDRGLGTINLASSVFSFAGLMTGLSANFVISKIGMRKATILSAVLYTIGMSIKLLINTNWYLLHLGEIVAGLGGPFVQYGIANFADHWFEGKQRGIYISILSTMNPIGTMVGFVYPFIFVSTKGTVT
jgi:MFS family permease